MLQCISAQNKSQRQIRTLPHLKAFSISNMLYINCNGSEFVKCESESASVSN